MILISSCGCLRPIYWSQVLSREWRCGWSSAAPTTSEWSTISLLTNVHLILEVWRYSYYREDLSIFSCPNSLTHWGRDELGQPFADDNLNCILFNEKARTATKISLKFFHKGPIDNNPSLVQKMAWCWRGKKPLCKPTMFTDIYASLSLNELKITSYSKIGLVLANYGITFMFFFCIFLSHRLVV